jgi:hypothetical protein
MAARWMCIFLGLVVDIAVVMSDMHLLLHRGGLFGHTVSAMVAKLREDT